MQSIGPVGSGSEGGRQKPFSATAHTGELGGIRIRASESLDKITSYTREEIVNLSEQKLRSRGQKHWVFLAEGEYVTHVEVRALALVHGLRIHTNQRSTRWFGGFGGTLETLRPADGHKINGVFGTRGDASVGRLGVYWCAITEQPVAHQEEPMALGTITTSKTTGGGRARGMPSKFDYLGTPIGAIVVQCDDYVHSISVARPDVHARAVEDSAQAVYEANDQVFALGPSEYLVKVSVRSGAWMDAVQFHTNRRSSPWFGGMGGGDPVDLESGAGQRIFSFYGRKKQVVDLLGVYICEHKPLVVQGDGPVEGAAPP